MHVLPLLESATVDEAEVRRLTAASTEKKARRQQREEKLASKRASKEEKARQKLQKRMDAMKARLKGKVKKGKHAWQNQGSDEKRAKKEVKAAKQMVGMAMSSAIPIPVSNTGHQMLLALGWKGGGLGKKNDGRDQPVAAVVKLNMKGLGFVR